MCMIDVEVAETLESQCPACAAGWPIIARYDSQRLRQHSANDRQRIGHQLARALGWYAGTR